MSLKSNFTSTQALALVDYTGTARADVSRILNALVETSNLPEGAFEGIRAVAPNSQELAKICTRGCVVIFWRAAEFAVSDALSAGTPLNQAIQEWEAAHQALLGIYRKHRHSMVLVDFDQFTAAPADFAAELAAQTGLGFKGANEPAEFHVDPLYRAIAALQTLRSLPVTRMCGELEASSVRPADHAVPEDADNRRAELAMARYQKMLEQEKNAGQEGALLRDQIVAVQEELETSHRRVKELEADKAAAIGQSRQNELLTQQLHNVQAELEEYYRELQERIKACEAYENQIKEAHMKGVALQAELEESHGHYERRLSEQTTELAERDRHIGVLEQELAESRDKVTQLLGSTSWKLTGPIRKVKDTLKGGN